MPRIAQPIHLLQPSSRRASRAPLALDLRAEGRCKVFVFQDRPTRRDDVIAFYGDAATVRPLAFAATIKDMKGLLHDG